MADSAVVIGVGWAGTVLSILLYASQLPLMRRLVHEGDATLPGYSYLPVLGQIAQAGPWCGYAICIQPTIALIVANFVGVGFGVFYLTCFAVYTPTWRGRTEIFLSGIAVCGVIVGFYVSSYASSISSFQVRCAVLFMQLTPSRDLHHLPLTGNSLLLGWAFFQHGCADSRHHDCRRQSRFLGSAVYRSLARLLQLEHDANFVAVIAASAGCISCVERLRCGAARRLCSGQLLHSGIFGICAVLRDSDYMAAAIFAWGRQKWVATCHPPGPGPG
jgi:hypothetical protein